MQQDFAFFCHLSVRHPGLSIRDQVQFFHFSLDLGPGHRSGTGIQSR
ncbi:MAG: hypothetical protein ACLFRE_04460 [Desulfovermiculus sp.]